VRQQIAKNFYVSPFLGMDLDYEFRVLPPAEQTSVAITASDSEGIMIVAAMRLQRSPLNDSSLIRAVVAMPWMTLGVIAAIHWHALKIWLKRVPLVRRPEPPAHAVSTAARARSGGIACRRYP
jgi:DUF1365 family protein